MKFRHCHDSFDSKMVLENWAMRYNDAKKAFGFIPDVIIANARPFGPGRNRWAACVSRLSLLLTNHLITG